MSRIIPGDTDQFTNITGIGFRNNNNIYHYFYDKLTIRGNGKGYPRELYNMSQLKSLIDDTPGAIIEDKIMNLQRLKKIQISDVDNNNISEKLLEMPNLEKRNIAVKYDKRGAFISSIEKVKVIHVKN